MAKACFVFGIYFSNLKRVAEICMLSKVKTSCWNKFLKHIVIFGFDMM